MGLFRRALSAVGVINKDGIRVSPVREEIFTGTGLPIPLAVSDPGGNDWSDALTPNPITRDCTRLFYRVGSSGFEMSFDGGVTVHIARPEDTCDDMAIAIPQGADVRIRRLTAGTAIDGLIVEVR